MANEPKRKDTQDANSGTSGSRTQRDPPPTYEATTGYGPQGETGTRPQTRTQQPQPDVHQLDTSRSQYDTSRSQHDTSRSQHDTSRSQHILPVSERVPSRMRPDSKQRNGPRPKSFRQTMADQHTGGDRQTPYLNSDNYPVGPDSDLGTAYYQQQAIRQVNGAHMERENSKLTGSSSTNLVSVSQQNVRSMANSSKSSGPINGNQSSAQELDFRMDTVDTHLRSIMSEIEEVKNDLKRELTARRKNEATLAETEKEKRDLNNKLASLRVKLGVANANINVGKAETDQIRKKYQEAQIQKARLEERISACNQDLERMRDPNNPDSNVNMKKLVNNDRKEIRRLRSELEAVHAERDETHKRLIDKELKIKELELLIIQAGERKERVETDLELAISHKELEYGERKEIEIKYNEALEEKRQFDKQVSGIRNKIDVTSSGMTDMQRQAEEYRKKEEATKAKIEKMEKQLREVLIEIEQLKSHGRGMPPRIAGSIKDHQYRMSKGGRITETAPAGNVSAEQLPAPATKAGPDKAASKSLSKTDSRKSLSNFVPPPKPKVSNTNTSVKKST